MKIQTTKYTVMEVINMSKPNKDYTNCIPVMVPVLGDSHKDLKIYCTKNGVTMKEVLHEVVQRAIQELCDN